MTMCKNKKNVWFLGCFFKYCTIFPTVNHLLERGMPSLCTCLEAQTLTIPHEISYIYLCTNLKV